MASWSEIHTLHVGKYALGDRVYVHRFFTVDILRGLCNADYSRYGYCHIHALSVLSISYGAKAVSEQTDLFAIRLAHPCPVGSMKLCKRSWSSSSTRASYHCAFGVIWSRTSGLNFYSVLNTLCVVFVRSSSLLTLTRQLITIYLPVCLLTEGFLVPSHILGTHQK